jgi:hypothetical protein
MRRNRFLNSLGWSRKLQDGKRHRPLGLEALESRLTPVVGGNFWEPVLTPGTIAPANDPNIGNLDLDGVVKIASAADPNNFGTGSLLTDGLHILTAAHVADGTNRGDEVGNANVIFSLPPTAPGRVVPPISIPVPMSQQQPANAPGATWNGNWRDGNDISILTLTDPMTGGLMVAPYYGPQIGYPIVANGANANIANENQSYTLVGYGLTGTGTSGVLPRTGGSMRMGANNWQATGQLLNNELQTISVTGTPAPGLGGGSFTLTYTPPQGMGGQPVTTAPIPWNATAGQVQAALNLLAPLNSSFHDFHE